MENIKVKIGELRNNLDEMLRNDSSKEEILKVSQQLDELISSYMEAE